jgi:hypothetical protein
LVSACRGEFFATFCSPTLFSWSIGFCEDQAVDTVFQRKFVKVDEQANWCVEKVKHEDRKGRKGVI